MDFIVNIPLPPSANKLFANVGRSRIKTPQYKAWIQRATIAKIKALPITATWPVDRATKKTRYRVEIMAGIDYRRDLDNVIKPILDWLKTSGVITDDRYIDRLTAIRAPEHGPRAIVRVTIIG